MGHLLPPSISGNLRYRFIVLSVPIALAISASLLFVFWLLAQNLVDELGARISADQVLLDRARAALPLNREYALAVALSQDPTIAELAKTPHDEAARARGFDTLERFRSMFRDGNYFFVPDTTKEFHFKDRPDAAPSSLVKYTLAKSNPDDAWYFSTIALSGICYLNIDFDRAIRETKVWFNCNIRDRDTDDVLGIVGTGIDLTAFIDQLQQSQPDGVTTIYVDEDGAIQAHPNVDLIEHDALTKPDNLKNTIFNILDNDEDRERLKQALIDARARPDKATTVAVSSDGRDVLVGATFMPQINWFSISVIELRTFVLGHYFIPLAILVTLAVLVSLTALGIALDKIVLKRIDRLDRAVNAFKDGESAGVEEPGDATPDQLDRLRLNFNEMAETVTAHTTALSEEVAERTQELQQKHDELLTLNRQKDKFFSIIAHDLIGPFSSLIGVSDYLKNRAEHLSREKIVEYSGDLNDAATNLHQLLENLLAWSRLQQGDLRFAPVATDLPTLLTETASLLRPMIEQKSIDLVLDLPGQFVATVDPNMIETIVRNLIGNALKFSNAGSRIKLSLTRSGDSACISVSDQGIGIPREILEKLLDLGASTSRKGTAGETGTGLGLQLCMEMIELHGGGLKIESEQGKGSTFYIYFPINSGHSES
ncbi:MAG: sensor histidine kinase [Rhodospirillales bacterium]|nr:sensor histidine kinase [Rhodospirillales bacterium]